MYKIAVVDDEAHSRALLRGYIERFVGEKNEQCAVYEFSDGMDFISGYTHDYDVVFMDIDMPLLDGMETAKRLRQADETVILIFITNMAQCAINGYEVDASDFLLKPVGYFTFSLKLSKALRLRGRRTGAEYCIKTSEGKVRIRVSDIFYIESVKHYCVFHTAQGDFRMRLAIKDAESEFADKRFVRCNNAYLVNLAHVTRVRQDTVSVGGYELVISRTKKKIFLDAFTVYLGGGVIDLLEFLQSFLQFVSDNMRARSLFVTEIFAAELLLSYPFPRRPRFALRCCLSVAAYFAVGFFFPESLFGMGSYVTYIIFAVSVALNRLCFDYPLKKIIFNCSGAYGLQGLVTNISIIVRAAFHIPAEFRLLVDFLSCIAVYSAGYFLIVRRRGHEELNMPSVKVIALCLAVLLVADFMSKIATSQGVGTNIVVRVSLSLSVILALCFQYSSSAVGNLETENERMEELLKVEQEQYRMSRETVDLVNMKCHDLKHQIGRIRADLRGEGDEALKEMEEAVLFYENVAKTGNDALDSVLTEKSLYCERWQIKLTYIVDGKSMEILKPSDVYSMMGNAIDNAIECVIRESDAEKRVIFLNIGVKSEILSIHLENYCPTAPVVKDGLPVTTKDEKQHHGIGMRSIFYIARKYGGNVVFGTQNSMFTLDIMIPVPTAPAAVNGTTVDGISAIYEN